MDDPHDLLQALRRACGLPEQAADGVRIDGRDPVIGTPYKVAQTGAAAIAATGMAAAWLLRLRGRRVPCVTVDAVAAAAAMQSYKFLRIDGRAPGPVMDRLTGFYAAGDGRWVYLHCNFPNLAAANCRALGAAHNPGSLVASVAGRAGADVEEAIMAGGGGGALVRTEDEWRASPQGIAAAAEPPVTLTRIGDAPPRPLPQADRPLHGVRVLDLTRVLAGPTCAKTLAEHGADVLRISRRDLPNSGVLDLDTSVGKRSAWLDLRDPPQRQTMLDLVRGCDVFSQAYRPGALDRHGLSAEALAALRPGIVYVCLNAWGYGSPWRERRGFDTVVQAANGMAWSAGDGRPAQLPVAMQDYVAGYLMAYGAMAALARRAEEGGTWQVRVSLAACGEWIRRHGTIAASRWTGLPSQVPEICVRPWLVETRSPAGRLTQLGPVARLSGVDSRWDTAVVAEGSCAPAWLSG